MTGIGHLFKTGAIVKVILNMDESKAYIQNADTNKYLEDKFSQKADLEDGKVPATQLPEMNYIPNSEKGKASGVATLDGSGKVPTSQLPMLSYSKEEILSEATKIMYGLNASATPNTVFQKLAMPYGYYGFDVTTVFSNGRIAPNIVLNGLEDLSGNTARTDSEGRCRVAVAQSATPTVTISGYFDVVDTSVTLSAKSGEVFTPVQITLEANTDTQVFYSSVSKLVTGAAIYDFTAIGGGGGGTTNTWNSKYKGGAGGGGGYIVSECGVSLNCESLSFEVAAGGACTIPGDEGGEGGYAGSGGTTYVKNSAGDTIVSASGGSGAVDGIGGSGNGAGGGARENGHAATGYLFNDASLGVPGGGGGGGSYCTSGEGPYAGGAPHGGRGAYMYWGTESYVYHHATSGTGAGAGGGGGFNRYQAHAANGSHGAVFMRARFE